MNTDLRNRVVLPLLLPIVILLGIAVLVGGLALILLNTPHVVGLTVALVVAAGVMVAFSLANAVEEQDMTLGRRAVIVLVAAVPLLGGGGAALWAAGGGVPPEELPINFEPLATAPEGALAGAKNAESFCEFEDPDNQTAETCTDVDELTFPAQPESDLFAFTFNNVDDGVPHNLQLFELADDGGEPAPGAGVFLVPDGSEVITGPAEITYEAEQGDPPLYEEGAQFYYNCVVHPVMDGVLTIGPPAGEGGEGGDGGEG